MLIQRLLLVVAIPLSLQSGVAFSQDQQMVKSRVVKGYTEVADGCPVTLSDATYLLTEYFGGEQKYKITKESVKITNASARGIAKVIVSFSFEGGGGMGMIITQAGPIPIGETYNQVSGGYLESPGSHNGHPMIVRPFAVEFADGTHWIAPRTPYNRLRWMSLIKQLGPLTVRECRDLNKSYRAVVKVNLDHVVAYRLGVVKDTPSGFEVRLGRWVDAPQPTASKDGPRFAISANDEVVSLTQAEIFRPEKHIATYRDRTSSTDYCGVALFVAGVRLADGTVIEQNLDRNELLWGEMRQ
ncbi:MAG: hypothetical protein AB7U82_02355 [Blastocatellales bacterium]